VVVLASCDFEKHNAILRHQKVKGSVRPMQLGITDRRLKFSVHDIIMQNAESLQANNKTFIEGIVM